ncbi:MAG: CoA ester lyase [Paracoccus sp. BP8]|nr:MAG: CoA ester lyase [Paracoccus sp. BP8]
MPLRSLLFCPGSNPGRMRKAMAAGADAVILDLEDSVDPSAKAEARAMVAEALAGPRSLLTVVRINAEDSPHHLSDLAMALRAGADAVMLPKCNGPADLLRLSQRMDALEAAFDLPQGHSAILPLVTESAMALLDMDYRGVTPRLAALCFAGEDLASDLGVMARANGQMNALLSHARRQVAIAAAAAGVRAIDTPFPDPRSEQGLELETREAMSLGFSGKLCIHPAQVATVHATLRPAPERVAWGRAVIAALEGAASGVAVVDGKMVDIAHLRLARRYVQMGEASA